MDRIKLLSSLILILVVFIIAFFLSDKIVNLHLRTLIIVLSFLILFFSTFNIKRGTFFLLGFISIMPYLRRLTYISESMVKSDPMLIVPDVIFIWMLLGYWFVNESYLLQFIRKDRLTKVYVIFIVLCFLSVFNPLQGSLLVGLTGAKFFILPSMWFFIGLGFERNDYKTLFKFIIIVGALAGLYSLYQYLFGFTEFEWQWIKEVELKLTLKEKVRPFSIFAGTSDSARFFQISAGLSLFFLLSKEKVVLNLISFAISLTALLLTVSRSAVFALLLSIGVYFIWRGEEVKKIVIRSILLFLFVIGLYAVIPEEYKEAPSISERTFATHLKAGLLNPVREQSAQVRFEAWKNIPSHLLKSPIGYGIGSITLGAKRYKGFLFYTESSYFSIWGATGIIGGLLFTYMLYLMFRYLIDLYKWGSDKEFMRIVIGFVSGLTASIIIAELFNFYAVAPFFWITLSWLVREHRELKNAFNNNS